MTIAKNATKRRRRRAATQKPRQNRIGLRLHPLFLIVGIWYCFRGQLFLFLVSCLVAIQHECAHAFAAARLGYKLNRVVLMPFGAMIDGDLKDVSLKDEIYIALCGPLCNLFTAALFAALWWISPDTYAFTDVACFSSLSIAIVNLLPAYPLDGGRIVRCLLTDAYLKKYCNASVAERKAEKTCFFISLALAALLLVLFLWGVLRKEPNGSLLPFAVFLAVGAFGNKKNPSFYGKIDYACHDALRRGVEIRRVAITESRPVKDALRYVTQGYYLVLELYDEKGVKIGDLPQNELDSYFRLAPSPYTPLSAIRQEKERGMSALK